MNTMLKVERTDARTWSEAHLKELFDAKFPAFIRADRLADRYMSRVLEWFADLSLIVLADDVPVASGCGVPIHWNGQPATLPSGYTQALVRAVEGREQGVVPDTLVICGAVVASSAQGRGIAGDTLMALRRTAVDTAGLRRVIVPVRPTAKAMYPLVPIERYMTWRRDDGTAFDPWVRTHERVGAVDSDAVSRVG